MNDCIECGAPVRNNEAVCVNCLDVESELMAMLQEPTAVTVQRKQIAQDIAMQKVGLSLKPLINALLATAHKGDDDAG